MFVWQGASFFDKKSEGDTPLYPHKSRLFQLQFPLFILVNLIYNINLLCHFTDIDVFGLDAIKSDRLLANRS